ncbi:Uncharacterised protein [Enterobacter asburiae]|uniref:Uncharacterized protein n=1 Tax=Enterobacter asburiae TaxID=61645 RepID=A0A376FAF7_ENTAS|nr:Uncharacterised protein [Enterobacter asburiae]
MQDILAAASGYQSVTSEPALNRKRPKTLDDYPVIPPASKKVSVISSDLTLYIGFDTEYVSILKHNRMIFCHIRVMLSYPIIQVYRTLSIHLTHRKNPGCLLRNFSVKRLHRFLKTGVITKWPGIINIYAHFIRAEIASFANFWSDYKILLKGIRGTVSSFKNRYGIDFDEQQERRVKTEQIMFDKRTSPPRCSNVAFIDTLLITSRGYGSG